MLKQIRTFFLILWGSTALWSHLAAAATITITVPTDSLTIANALTTAKNNPDDVYNIVLKQGTYREHITLVDNVTLEAEIAAQTALTVIDGSGAGTINIATITAAKGSTIRRLTITNGDVGISIPDGATGVTIENNIITEHRTAGIQCTNTNTDTISYNTIYNSGTAITCTNSTINIKNNILSNNTANDISLTLDTSPPATNNLFFSNGNEDYADAFVVNKNTSNVIHDPLFVDPSKNDFHLQKGPSSDPNPAISADPDRKEIGVYGGGNNDRPFAITNLSVTTATDTSIAVTWDPNLAHNISGYNVYYNAPDEPRTLASSSVPTYQISGLTGSQPSKPDSPPNFSAGIGDGELQLTWSPVTPVTVSGYRIHYGTTSGIYDVTLDKPGRSSSSHDLTGLVNGTKYYIAIEAVATPPYFVTVTALDDINQESTEETVEAHLTSPETQSDLSPEISATPEPPARFPDLPNEGGCFIATAAYGSPLEPHVQTLRAFRDRYLLTHSLGRKFVAFYYQTSPPMARWLEEHASFKPVVRAFLSPIVFVTEFWIGVTPFAQALIIILILSLGVISVYRWGVPNRGGHY